MLLDIIKPDSGEIRIFGGSLSAAAKDRIGYLPEERGLYRKTKLLDTLVYLARLKNVPLKEAQTKAEALLKSLDLYEHRGKKVEELSKGMQQKIQFLSAVVHEPELIILDEPFSGLDPVSTKAVKDKILEYRNEGKTVILSTHMMEQAQKLCDRILMLNKGERVLYGTVAGIRKEHGKNSLLVEFAEKRSLSILHEIPGIRKITWREGAVEILPEESTNAQAILQELVRRAEILRFEQALPSLNEIFIETVESVSGE